MNRILFFPHELQEWAIGFDERLKIESKDKVLRLSIPMYDMRAIHIRDVLKPDKGQSFQAGIINQEEGLIYIDHVHADCIELRYEPVSKKDALDIATTDIMKNTMRIQYHIHIAHTRPPVMARIIKDLCSMQVASIHIYASALTEKSYLNSTIWHKKDTLLLLGAMQGASYKVPYIVKSYTLEESLVQLNKYMPKQKLHKLLCDAQYDEPYIEKVRTLCLEHTQKNPLIQESAQESEQESETVNIVVSLGPERGFLEKELATLENAGFVGYSLGHSVLRSESASILCAGIIHGYS